MSFLASMAGGIGEGMQQTGDMFAKKALVEAQAARHESLMRLGIELQLEKEETIYQRERGRAPERLEGELTRQEELGAVEIDLAVKQETATQQAALTFYNDNRKALLGQISDAAELQQKIETEGKRATFDSIKHLLPPERAEALWVQFATGIDIEPAAMKRMTEHEAVTVWMDLYDKNMEAALADQPGVLKGLYKKGMSQKEIQEAVILMTNEQLGTAQIAAGIAKENILDGARFSNALRQVMNDGQREGKTVEEVIEMALDPNIGGIPANRREEVEQTLRSVYHPEAKAAPSPTRISAPGEPFKFDGAFSGLESEAGAQTIGRPIDPPTPSGPVTPKQEKLLRQLDKLQEDGYVTPEEYEERRQSIIRGY